MRSEYMDPVVTVISCAAEDMIRTSSLRAYDNGSEIFVEY